MSVQLPARFMEAVDNVAMAAGLSGTDDYLAGFRWSDPVNHPSPPSAAANAVMHELVQLHATLDTRGLIRKLLKFIA